MPISASNKPRSSLVNINDMGEGRGKPRLLVTLGDPAGIGPEVSLKAVLNPQIKNKAKFLLVGDRAVIEPLKKRLNINNTLNLLDLGIIKEKINYGRPNPVCARASLAYIEKAVELIKKNEADLLVTAPVNKEAINSAGYVFSGHTEYLANLDKAKNVVMMFTAPRLKISLVTRHMALGKVSAYLKEKDIFNTIIMSAEGLKRYFGLKNPKIAVCALNPHNGEGGRFGREETKIILPAVLKAKKYISGLTGPQAADTLFTKKEAFDLIVAMYHDQGMIPIKMLGFKKAVNVTLGLSFIRTSPAHGTAYDIAGKGIAQENSMVEAIKTALYMFGKKQ